MFTDLFNLVHSLEHDYIEENEVPVHSLACRRCALTTRLTALKGEIRKVLQDVDFAIGDPFEKSGG